MADNPPTSTDYEPVAPSVYADATKASPPDDTLDDTDVKRWVKGLGRTKDKPVPSDDEFNKNREAHEGSYTEILKAYETDIKSTLTKKAKYKPKVFWLSFLILLFACLLVLGVTVALIIMACIKNDLALWIMAVTEVLLAFLATFIVIPQVITNYLFNTEEEKYMSEIIKNIQTYDRERLQNQSSLNTRRKKEAD